MAGELVTVEVKGLKELEDSLSTLGHTLAKRALRQALKAGGEVLLEAVKRHCPVWQEATPQRRPGELRDALTAVIKLSGKEEKGTVTIGVKYDKADGSQSPAVYASFVEFGSIHNPHPKPFLRPGFDEAKDQALEKFEKVLSDGVKTLGK